jgi:homoserine O-acetyltransferase
MSASGASFPGERQGDLVVRDFAFQGGERLPEVRLHYLTLGEPRRGPDGHVANAVLLLHGTTSTARQFLSPTLAPELFGPGQPLDASRFFLVLPDGLGRGGSSKPSDGLGPRFPRYGYGDVVAAQHLVVTLALGLDRLRLVVGTSMGGMHAWMWAERYPDLVDAVMPIACQPRALSGRNLLLRLILAEAIRNDPGFEGGAYRAPPRHWLATAPLWPVMVESAASLQAEAPTRPATLALYARLLEEARRRWDANDFLAWLESSADYDPAPGLAAIRAKVLAVNFADDLLNPAELPETEQLVRSVPGARFVLVPASAGTVGHHTHGLAAVWKPYLVELLAALGLGPPERRESGARLV